MTEQALIALRLSVEHWERLAEDPVCEKIGRSTCPLCRIYNRPGIANYCLGCPVREHTGQPFCRGTPYDKACETVILSYSGFLGAKAACLKELEFLKSLLPKD